MLLAVLAQTDVVMFWALAVLNLALAVLVSSVRPLRTSNRLLAAMFVLHALVALGIPWYNADDQAWRAQAVFAVNLLTVPLVAALPFVAPKPVGSLRFRRIGFVALWVLVVPGILAGPVYKIVTGSRAFDAEDLAGSLGIVAQMIVPAIGIVLLTRMVLTDEAESTRRIALFLLAAYLLRAGTQYLVPSWIDGPRHDYGGESLTAWVRDARVVRDVVSQAILYAAVAFSVAAVVGAAIRRRLPGVQAAFLLAAVGLGITMRWHGWSQEFEYLLLRPLLLAFGILQFQVVGADVRRNVAVLGVGLVASTAATYLAMRRVVTEAGGDEVVAGALAVTGTVAVGVAFLVPMLRLTASPGEGPDRRLTVYQAALEGGDAGSTSLAGLREALGISDREHALITSRLDSDQDHLAPGRRFLGRYDIIEPLGGGGGGRVVRAQDTVMGRDVAIKAIDSATADREARLTAAVTHPNLVRLQDVERIGDTTYLVMEYVAGGSLRKRIDHDGPMAPGDAGALARGILAGLGALHQAGIVHRDIKPSNVLLHEAGPRLSDMGIAAGAGIGGDTKPVGVALPPGTPSYLSPERARGDAANVASDLWAVAALLYEAVEGRPPVDVSGCDLMEAAARLSDPHIEPPTRAGALRPVIERGLDVRRSQRFPDAESFAAAIEVAVANQTR